MNNRSHIADAQSRESEQSAERLRVDGDWVTGDVRSQRIARCVCVLDPDPAIRDGLHTLLELGGHNAHGFSTAGEFFRTVPMLDVDGVICEAALPDASGFDVYRHIRAMVRPVNFMLLVSGSVSPVFEQADRLGIEHVFAKPVMHADLLALIALSGSTDSAS